MNFKPMPSRAKLAATCIALGTLTVAGCGGGGSADDSSAPRMTQPILSARTKAILTVDGYQFRDSNGSGTLDPYEDWRLSMDQRVQDLVARMTVDEKAGMLLIDTLNAPVAPSTISSTNAERFINTEKMTRFIFRNAVQLDSTTLVSPQAAAEFTNAVQSMAEATRLGIPVIFKSNARNHYDRSARQGINEPAGSFSQWPKEPGLAAIRDMDLIRDFGQTIGAEWAAIGLRGAYAYMADTATEPRWFRVHEVFSEDADLNASIMTNLVGGMQGGPVTPTTKVAMTIKHFPGGGPAAGGLDAHYTFGKYASYSGGRFGDHLKPFKAAIDAGVSAIMPYYSVPQALSYGNTTFQEVGFAFNRQAVTDLMKTQLGFKGYVNSDTGIITQRAGGL
ncbi:MAG: beta-glucosidase [Pseudomonadota bacterium]|nr:beta-glucosidase [Pseudomonadota bacterium]